MTAAHRRSPSEKEQKEKTQSPHPSGASYGDKMRHLFPICSVAGLAVGVALSALLEQRLVSLGAAGFFASMNMIHDRVADASTLALINTQLCAFLGYGFGAVCRLGWLLCTAAEWNEDAAMPFRMPLFLILVTLFHMAEFTFTIVCHPEAVEFKSFLLTPVPYGGYSIAMIAAIAEFWTGFWLFGNVGAPLPNWVGLPILMGSFSMAVCGWTLRTLALFTAGSNFTHLIAGHKTSSHQLITHGVYSLCRHPGYLGWFLWSVSTQLVLGNPMCLAAYGLVSWKFFAGRIPGEEALLISFFGKEYEDYARAVPCGLPWMSRLV